MTVLTLNELKTKEEVMFYLQDEKLLPKNANEYIIESSYFTDAKEGTYNLKIIVKYHSGYVEDFNYIIQYVSNEKVIINDNAGPMYLTSLIIIIIVLICVVIKVRKKLIIKRKNKNNKSLEQ